MDISVVIQDKATLIKQPKIFFREHNNSEVGVHCSGILWKYKEVCESIWLYKIMEIHFGATG